VTSAQSPVTWNTSTDVSADISKLTDGTTYHFRGKAENSLGIVYGNDMSFTTPSQFSPTANISEVTNLNPTTATLNGAVAGHGLSTTVTFEYGTTTSYGSTVTPAQSPVTCDGFKDVRADISGLTAGTTYHVRMVAENSHGITYGNDMEFTTPNQSASTATTWGVTNLTSTTGTLNGSVNGLGLPTTVTFEYDADTSIWDIPTSYGNTVIASQSPVTENGIINVSADISGLTPCLIYHFRIRAENSLGVIYGSDQYFYKVSRPTVTTTPASGITSTTAIVGGDITSDGGSAITERGVIWWLTSNHSGRARVLKDDSIGTGRFTCTLSGLQPNTSYYVRSYAKNCLSTRFIGVLNWTEGDIIRFTTSP
jgi:phosphodiesterase/alkaline phosphatase D-like protein